LVAIEAWTGGKRTLVDALSTALTVGGPRARRRSRATTRRLRRSWRTRCTVASVTSPTRCTYGVLFALDRRAAADELRASLAESDVLLVDRYLASNAAYGPHGCTRTAPAPSWTGCAPWSWSASASRRRTCSSCSRAP